MSKKLILILPLLWSSTQLAHATESLDQLRQKIEYFLANELTPVSEGKIEVSAGQLDSRLNLQACPEDKLRIFNPYKTALLHARTIGVKCENDQIHWSLYVPVSIRLVKTVVLAKHYIPQGNTISDDDVYEAEEDVQPLKQGYFMDTKEVVGKLSRYNIPQGYAISPKTLELPKLVLKNEQVTIIAKSPSFSVTMEGIALNEGILGETIKVKNLSSKRVIEGTVSSRKAVTITM